MRDRVRNLEDSVVAAMRQQRIVITDRQHDDANTYFSFRVRDAGQIEAARNAVRDLDRAAQPETGPNQTIVLRFNEQALNDERRRAVAQSVEIVRRRIDETGTLDPTIQIQGQDRILVQLPGVRDPERIKALLGRTAKMDFHLLDPQNTPADVAAGRAPASIVLPGDRDVGGGPQQYVVQRRIAVAGDRLVDAQPNTDGRSGEWIVNFTFDSLGARQFGDLTRENVGRNLAIVLDNRVISAPTIREPITGGRGQISGSFTAASASDLAVLLRAGALPAPLTVVEERSVGPDLGADSIRAGAIASIIAVVLVVVFMVLAYGLFGLFANIALLANLFLIIAACSVGSITLTLPGIAGIVLTMGMAVDANVLIYERIREEIRNGRTPLSSIETGFTRALATIIDSNLTTLLAGILLFMLGSGPVRGFAVVLCLGIVTSMFTAVLLTRLIVAFWYRRTRPKLVPL
jgi:preprotein translocase subunit SecD